MLRYMVFDVEVATKYGTNVSIILGNINYWIQKNRENGKHFHDGRYWTYNTVAAFHALMPFMSANVINTALKRAEEEGLLVTGNYNKLPFDRKTARLIPYLRVNPFPKNQKWGWQKSKMTFLKMREAIPK